MNRLTKAFITAALIAGVSCAFAQDLHAINAATVTAPAVAPADRPEPNAFLRSRAMTHEKLMAEVKNDPIVMSRFKRHFGLSAEGVCSMFDGLHASELKEDGVYLVYNCPESGELRAKSIFYKRGTQVWCDAMGTPVLKMSCGNPLARGSDHLVAATYTDLQPSSALMPLEGHIEGNTEGTPLEALAPAEVPTAAMAPIAATPVSVETSHGGGAGWLAFLPLAGLAFIHTGGGGCDTPGGCTPPPPPSCTNGTQCVPEPISTVALLLGVGGVAARKFRKKQ